MRRNSFLILGALAIVFASCGKKGGSSGLLVPKDAAIVIHVNNSSLSSKLSWAEIQQSSWFKQVLDRKPGNADDSMAMQLLSDPDKSGVNLKSDLVVYIKKQGWGGYAVAEGSLNDASAFEKMLTESKHFSEVKKDGSFSYMHAIKTDGGAVVWNKSKFAFISNSSVPSAGSMMKGRPEVYMEPHQFLQDSLRIFAQQALDLKDDDNLDNDKRFADLVKDGRDIHVWVNGEYTAPQNMENIGFMKTDILYKKNIGTMSFNFDNGKISGKMKQYYGDEISKILDQNKPQPVTAATLNRIPSQNVAAVIAFNFPPQAIKDLLKALGVDGLANGYLSKMNYSTDEFVKALKGETLFAITDFAMATKLDTVNTGAGLITVPHTKPDMKFVFATSVNDQASFEKLVTMAWESSKQMGMDKGMSHLNYKVENGWFAASSDAATKDQFLAGGNSSLPFVDKITGHPVGIYVDMQKIMGVFGGSVKDSAAIQTFDASRNMWQDVVVTGGDYKDKGVEFNVEVNLMDKSTNSLKQLNRYFDTLHKINADRMKSWHAPAMTTPQQGQGYPPVQQSPTEGR
jgi:hypothetical protein